MALFAPGKIRPWKEVEVFELDGDLATPIFNDRYRSVTFDYIPVPAGLVKIIFGR